MSHPGAPAWPCVRRVKCPLPASFPCACSCPSGRFSAAEVKPGGPIFWPHNQSPGGSAFASQPCLLLNSWRPLFLMQTAPWPGCVCAIPHGPLPPSALDCQTPVHHSLTVISCSWLSLAALWLVVSLLISSAPGLRSVRHCQHLLCCSGWLTKHMSEASALVSSAKEDFCLVSSQHPRFFKPSDHPKCPAGFQGVPWCLCTGPRGSPSVGLRPGLFSLLFISALCSRFPVWTLPFVTLPLPELWSVPWAERVLAICRAETAGSR